MMVRFVGALLVLIFGVFAVGNWTSVKWVTLTLIAYSCPFALQFFPNRQVQVYGLWFGIFLVLQTLITPLVIDRNYKTLPPNMVQKIDVIGDAMPGINGLQSITTDGLGFRVTKPVDYESKPAGTFRIFAIGGSTTEQIVIDDERTWAHLLQQRLEGLDESKSVEVINTGISGARAIQHLSTLRRIIEFEPDLVVFLMGINDWNRHIWNVHGAPESRNPGVPSTPIQFSQSLLGLILKGVLTEKAAYNPEEVVPDYGEYYSSQNDSLTRPVVKSFLPADVSDDYSEAVEAIGATCSESAVDCMFVTQPTAYSASDTSPLLRYLWMTPPNTDYTLTLDSLRHVAKTYDAYLINYASENGFPFCDLTRNFVPSIDHLYDDCHFNTAGSKHVADILAPCVTRTDAWSE
jgi:lysophospholipase L1-like esterase